MDSFTTGTNCVAVSKAENEQTIKTNWINEVATAPQGHTISSTVCKLNGQVAALFYEEPKKFFKWHQTDTSNSEETIQSSFSVIAWVGGLPNKDVTGSIPRRTFKPPEWNHLNVSLLKVNWAAQQKYKCEPSYKSEILSPDPAFVSALGYL